MVQYRVRRTADGVEVRVVTGGRTFDAASLERRLRTELETAGLTPVQVVVLAVA